MLRVYASKSYGMLAVFDKNYGKKENVILHINCQVCWLFSVMVRNVSITFFMRGVQRFSFMFWSRNFLMPSNVSSWVCVRRLQFIVPYWSRIWFRNWKTGRWVFMKGVRGFVLPYF